VVRSLALLFSLSILVATVPIVPIAESRTYFVDALNGNDFNPGTSSAPWKTIQKAADTISAGSVAHVRAGTYNERVIVTRSGSHGAFVTFEAQGNVVMQGFTIYADYVRVIGFEITNSNIVSPHGTGVAALGRFNEIRNNRIHDLLLGEGIWLMAGANRPAGLTGNNTVEGNRIVRARVAGILAEDTNDLITDNDISHTIQNPPGAPPRPGADADGIRFFGSGHTFRRNYIHDITLKDVGNTNPHIDAFQTWGPCSNMLLEENMIWQMESPDQGVTIEGLIQPVGNITIRNNVFMTSGTGYAPAVLAGGAGLVTNVSIVNNTMVALNGPSDYAFWLFSNLSGGVVENNAIYDYGTSSTHYIRIDPGASGLDIGFNSISKSNGQAPAGSPYPGDLWMVDPEFVNFARRNFHLKSTSPLIHAGTPLSIVPIDFDGRSRPRGVLYDIGAFQYRNRRTSRGDEPEDPEH
jgi:hypothetical protein